MEPLAVVAFAAALAFISWLFQRAIVARRQARDEFISMQVKNDHDHARTTSTLIGVTTAIGKLGDEVVLVREDVAHIKGRLST